MPKINLKKITTEARHTVLIPLTYEEDGQIKTGNFRIVYRGLSLRKANEILDSLEKLESEREVINSILEQTIVAMPDFVDDNDEEAKPTAEFFDSMDVKVLKLIKKTIEDDRDPNK